LPDNDRLVGSKHVALDNSRVTSFTVCQSIRQS
jgi:hypothetical protein